jgi:hypothetical protein
MAQHLAQTDPDTYPEFSDALSRVEFERGKEKGWGEISDELGFKLGPVISQAQKEGQEIRMETKEGAQKSKDLMKEVQKESKQNAKESRQAVNDTLKEAKEIKADPKGK